MASDWPRTFSTARLFLFSIEITDKQIQYYQLPTQLSYCARNKCIEHLNIELSSLKIFILFLLENIR